MPPLVVGSLIYEIFLFIFTLQVNFSALNLPIIPLLPYKEIVPVLNLMFSP